MAYGSYYFKFILNGFFSYWDVPAMIVSSLTRNAETINTVLQVQKVNPPVFAVCGYVYKPLPWPGVCKQLSKNELRTWSLIFGYLSLSLSFHILCWCCCCCHLNVLKWPKKINRHKNIAENVGRFLSFTWFWCEYVCVCVCVTKWAIMNVCVARMFVWV